MSPPPPPYIDENRSRRHCRRLRLFMQLPVYLWYSFFD